MSTTGTTASTGAAVGPPPGGLRAPCPCGSGKRYKQCHGRIRPREDFVARPFGGLPGETDLVALRELVPAATMALRTTDGDEVTFASVLPLAWPALRRPDGSVHVGLQTSTSSGDPSRDLAAALDAALAVDPGTPVTHVDPRRGTARLQDRIDPAERPEPTVHESFAFWVAGLEEGDELGEPGTVTGIRASLERADAAAVPTEKVAGVPSAYWVRLGGTTFVRWVVSHPEDTFMDALARLHAARAEGGGGSSLGEGTRFAGAFRALGLLVPVWDLGPDATVESVEEPLAVFAERLAEVIEDARALTGEERRARAGLVSRQITLR